MLRSLVATLTIIVTALAFTSLEAKKGAYPLTIELSQSVHFLNPEGEEVIAAQGTYEVSEAETGLYLVPVKEEKADKILVEAQENHHDEQLASPMVVALPAEAWDKYILLFMLPEGKVLEALGSYSGVRTRTVKDGSMLEPKGGTVELQRHYAKIVQLQKQKLQLQQQVGMLNTQLDGLRLQDPSPERDAKLNERQLDLQQARQQHSRTVHIFSTMMKQWHDAQKGMTKNVKEFQLEEDR